MIISKLCPSLNPLHALLAVQVSEMKVCVSEVVLQNKGGGV
jgi:hypothetical protein